jgi:hypothetical protein
MTYNVLVQVVDGGMSGVPDRWHFETVDGRVRSERWSTSSLGEAEAKRKAIEAGGYCYAFVVVANDLSVGLVETLTKLLKEREWSERDLGGPPCGDRYCETCDAHVSEFDKVKRHKPGCELAIALRAAGLESEME